MNANPPKSKVDAGDRRQSTEIARCHFCRGALPSGASSWRKFCSDRCRHRSWAAANPAPDAAGPDAAAPIVFGRAIRAHFHRKGLVAYLAGHANSPGWFGKGCPPECGGLRPGETAEPAPTYWRR
jgi:hypothetical protein